MCLFSAVIYYMYQNKANEQQTSLVKYYLNSVKWVVTVFFWEPQHYSGMNILSNSFHHKLTLMATTLCDSGTDGDVENEHQNKPEWGESV